MTEITRLEKNLYSFPIVLPNNPLKWLNCYVLKGGENGKNLIIDTGFNLPECQEALLSGIEQLGLVLENTDVFVTHMHADHTGNAAMLQRMGCNILMGRVDYNEFLLREDERQSMADNRVLKEGLPAELVADMDASSRSVIYSSQMFTPRTVEDGELLRYGDFLLRCIFTPGHTPGHMCLYEVNKKIMFLGDHVLFDITPNICAWDTMDDSLGSYLESIEKIQQYDIALALPAHRNCSDMTVRERVAALKEHHRFRLDEAARIIGEHDGLTAYQIAAEMTWSIRCADWDSFPVGQKFFAIGETLAHLDNLIKAGKIYSQPDSSGVPIYKAL